MNLLFRVIHGSCCRSTHHKLALDALRYLKCEHAEDWRNLYLHYYAHYLKGAKDPDTEFKDFRNHVLHVSDNYWGGAVKAANGWYNVSLEALKNKSWQFAVYDSGALSHYYTDPIQPFHTGQSQAESQIHRAAEWSICKSYDQLWTLSKPEDYESLELGTGPNWLEEWVVAGAEFGHPYYQTLIEHYDFHRGSKDPPAGLDDHSREILGGLLRYAAVGYARVLDRLFEESGMKPPKVNTSLKGLIESTKIPLRKIQGAIHDSKEMAKVKAIYSELQTTGCVERTLPEDDRVVRDLYFREVVHGKRRAEAQPVVIDAKAEAAKAKEAAKAAAEEAKPEPKAKPQPAPEKVEAETKPVEEVKNSEPKTKPKRPKSHRHQEPKREEKAEPEVAMSEPSAGDDSESHRSRGRDDSKAARRPMGRRHVKADPTLTNGGGAAFLRFCYNLELTSDVEAAPSIGAKTAQRFYEIGVNTVGDLLALDPDHAAMRLDVRHITGSVIRDWQDQASLVLRIPRIKGHDAQILVACDYRDPEEIAVTEPEELLEEALNFANSKKGQRILRSSKKPDLDEVSRWVEWAQYSRSMSDVGLELES